MRKIKLLLLFLFFIPFFVCAETCNPNDIEIESIVLKDKSTNVEEKNEASIKNNNVSLDLNMKEKGDSAEYILTIKNDTKTKYEINANSFNIDSNYIRYTIQTEDNSNVIKPGQSKEVLLKIDYIEEVPDESFNDGKYTIKKAVNININSEDKKIDNPETGGYKNIIILISILLLSIVVLITLTRKGSKFFVLLILLIPVMINAACKANINVEINVEVKQKPKAFLMGRNNVAYFFDTEIHSNDIESITFTNSIEGHTVNGVDCFDVSRDKDGSVLAWVSDSDSNELLEVTIGAKDKIYASDCEQLFQEFTNLTSINGMKYLDTSYVEDMGYMFHDCVKLISIDLSYFNTSKVKYFNDMFSICKSLEELDVSRFDTSNAVNVSGMFSGCNSLTSLNVSNFDTSKVTNISLLFNNCFNITTLNLSNFDTSKVSNIMGMFSGCNKLKTIYVSSDFVTTNVTNSIDMFKDCNELIGGEGTVFDSNHIDKEYAVIDGGVSNPGYFTNRNMNTATIFYNSNTTMGEVTIEQKKVRCERRNNSSECEITIPTSIISSIGKYNNPYYGISNSTNDMNKLSTFKIKDGDKLYALYQTVVTDYYYQNGSYNNLNLYRNEFFTSDSEMKSVLSNSLSGLTNYTPETSGPNGSVFVGYSTGEDASVRFETVEDAAKSNLSVLYSAYKYIVTYTLGNNSDSISKESDSCNVIKGMDYCNVILPSIEVSDGYNVGGFGTTASNIEASAGDTYPISSNTTLYAVGMKYSFENVNTSVKYLTLKDAFEHVNNNETIRMLSSATESIQAVLGENKIGIKLDLNGRTLKGNVGSGLIVNNGELDIIVSSSTGGLISVSAIDTGVIINNGKLTIDGMTSERGIEFRYTDDTAIVGKYFFINNSGATLTLNKNITISTGMVSLFDNSGTLIVNDGYYAGATINNSGHFELKNGEVRVFDVFKNSGDILVSGGTLFGYSNSTNDFIVSTGTITITGGTVKKTNGKIIKQTGGSLTLGINDGTVSNTYPAIITTSNYDSDGDVQISDSTIFNFYDGRITTTFRHTPISKDPDNIAPGYKLVIYNYDRRDTYVYLAKPEDIFTATMYYNSNSNMGEFDLATCKESCTPDEGKSSCKIIPPDEFKRSKGKYNASYVGASESFNSMEYTDFNLTGDTNYYAVYSTAINYYYYEDTRYKSKDVWKNEVFKNNNEIKAVISDSKTGIENFTPDLDGPNGSVFDGFSGNYNSIEEFLLTDRFNMLNEYKFDINFEKGSHVSEIGSNNSSCNVSYPSVECSVVLPTITPEEGYNSLGWSETNGADSGVDALSTYMIDTNNTTLYANAGKTLYGVFKNLNNTTSLVKEYEGEHKDSFTEDSSKTIYTFNRSNLSDDDSIREMNNVVFAGQCWNMFRTTDTGGVKMIYNGEYDETKKCSYTKVNHIGYTKYTTRKLNNNYYYGTDYIFNNESFQLSGTITTGEIKIGQYTCEKAVEDGTCNKLVLVDSFSNGDYYNVYTLDNSVNSSFIGETVYSNLNNSPAGVGYMSGDSVEVKELFANLEYMIQKQEVLKEGYITNYVIYADSVNYNSDTNMYSLVNARSMGYSIPSKNIIGKYIYIGTNIEPVEKVIYPIYISGQYLSTVPYSYYFLYFSDGKTLDDIKPIIIGDSFVKNEDGTYSITQTEEIEITNWTADYENYVGKYTCYNETGKCSEPRYIVSTNINSFSYVSAIKKIVFGKNKNGNILTDTISLTEEEYITNADNYSNYKYTCHIDSEICNSNNLRKIKSHSKNYGYYYYPNYKFGNSITWDGSKYILDDAIDIEAMNYDTSILNHRYFCLDNLDVSCENVYYIPFKSTLTSNYLYVKLTSGETENDVLNKVIKNKNDSIVKKVIESWYSHNLLTYDDYIEDTIYCNDREIQKLNGFDKSSGVFNETTFINYNYQKKSYICNNKTDQFSINNDTAKLKYKIGMLTVPEVVAMGNSNSILKSREDYFTMSPSKFGESSAIVAISSSTTWTIVNYDKGIRPVISLRPNITYSSGDGSTSDPYIIETE